MRLEISIILMLGIDLFLFFGQTAMVNINNIEHITNNSITFHSNALINPNDQGYNTKGELPPAQGWEGGVGPSQSSNFFTDVFSTLRDWVVNTPGINVVYGCITAFPNFLSSLGLDPLIAGALASFWHLLTLFLIVQFFKGG
jgi:hypothetical protein